MPGPALAVGDSQNNSGLAQGPLGAAAAASACGTCPNGPTGGAQLKREGGPWQIPLSYWKVAVLQKTDDSIAAAAFIMYSASPSVHRLDRALATTPGPAI